MAFSPRARILLPAASLLLGLTMLVWYLSTRPRPTPVTPIAPPAQQGELSPEPTKTSGATPTPSGASPATNSATPTPSPTTVSPSAEPASSPPGAPATIPSPAANNIVPPVSADAHTANNASATLLIPVVGIRPEQLTDTYTQSRNEGRTHNAIDIMAARNTPVVAAAAGQIIKLFNSERGGITLYQLGTDNRTVYYYAHLERYADGITENRFARRGELLGYVGDTGNAGKDNFHLHFSIWLITDPKRYWNGENVNPYPLLTR